MDQQELPPGTERRALFTRKEYNDPAEKKRDFWRGVGLWFVLNISLTLCLWGVSVILGALEYPADGSSQALSDIYSTLGLILNFMPFLINVGLVVFLAFTRKHMALGMLAGFGMALLVVICLGVVFMTACFVILGQTGY